MKNIFALLLLFFFFAAIKVFSCDWHWDNHRSGYCRARVVCTPTLIGPEAVVDLGGWFESDAFHDLPDGKTLTWKLYGPQTYTSWNGSHHTIDYSFSCTDDRDGNRTINSSNTGSTIYADNNSTAVITGIWSGFDDLSDMTCQISNHCGGSGGTYAPITFTAQRITPGAHDGDLQFTVTLSVSMDL